MSKKLFYILSALAIVYMPVPAAAATLSESILQAVSSHPQMKEGEAAVMQADKNVWEQRSAFFPTLGLSGEGGRLFNNDDTTRGATPGQGGAVSWMGSGTVTMTQPLFEGFSITNRYKGAKDRYSAAMLDMEGRAGDIAFRAARAHLNLMRTKELLNLASEVLSGVEARHKKIAVMVKGGAANEAERLQAEEILASARNTRLGYEEAFSQAEADYVEAVGSVPDGKLDIGEPVWNSIVPATADTAVSAAMTGHARLLSADKMLSSLQKDTLVAKADTVPHISAVTSYMKKQQHDFLGGEATSGQALLRLNWNFSLGGGQFARIQKSQEQEKEAAARRQEMARNIERDVRQKFSSMAIADRQFSLMEERESATKKIFKNFTSQYEGGKQSNLQLIAANIKMFEASASRTDSYYRRLLTRLDLLNAMGRLGDVFKAPKPGDAKKG